MSVPTLTYQGAIVQRNGTAAAWTAANPILLAGELALETDTSKIKIGDGVTAWTSLAYGGTVGPQGPTGATGATGPTGATGAAGSPTSLGAVGSTPNANAASISGSTLTLQPSSGLFPGVMTATQYNKLAGLVSGLNGVIDVTQQGTNSVLPGNTGAANNTALAAIMSAAASGSVLYFPGNFYPFASNISVPGKVFVFQGALGGVNGNLTGFEWTSNVAGDLITLTSANYYTQFRDILFTTSVAQTTGSVVNTNGNAYINFYRCAFSGLSSSNTLFNCINYNGSAGGEISVISDCTFTNFTGTAIIGGCNLQTFVIHGTTINGGLSSTTGAVCGVNITLGGAVQINDSDVIGCQNNLLINPTTGNVVASVFVMNTYFDNAFGSCIKITGAGATVRSKFTGCSFTVAANQTGVSAFECSTTVAAGAQGMDIVNCNVLNTFGAASCNGFNITGGADYSIQACNVAGWATGLNLTPNPTAGSTIARIQNNVIGTSGGYGVNTVGILLNAGSVAYGALEIQNNDCAGSTTPLTNNLTTNVPTNFARYRITDNAGINPKGTVNPPIATPVTATTYTNNTGYRCVVKYSGATITASTLNGVSFGTAVANANNFVTLDPGGTISLTGTTLAWVWVGN
jgi:hypothetical protein